MQGSALTLTGLTQRDGRRRVLDDISLEISAGAFVTLLGPPQSGKSALLDILAGFRRPSAGAVLRDGVALDRVPAHRRGFGVVQQQDALFEHLTLAENIGLPLKLRAVKPAARAALVETALDLLHLAHAGDLTPERASPAERQRAAIARAAVFEPAVLLLDEPLAQQDATARPTLIAALRRLHDMLGATVVMATANPADALALSDAIAVLRQGRVEQVASPDQLYASPATPFVANLVGGTNMLAGKVLEIDEDMAILRLDCGPQVEAQVSGRLEPGQACLMTIRPEHIAIAPVTAAEMGEAAIDATLIDVAFFGDFYRLKLLLGSGAPLIIHRPAATSLRGLRPGEPAAIAWQPHHALAFRKPAGG